MFSPWYAWTRKRPGGGDPLHHAALNVALYGRAHPRWALTERGRSAVARDGASLAIGPSAVAWDGATLTFRIAERGAPLPLPIRGTVRVHPTALTGHAESLDEGGRHRWSPIAPAARVEVALSHPSLAWSGPGYLDSNWGAEGLEDGFSQWDWSRAPLRDGTAILYDVTRRDGVRRTLALRIAPDGTVERFAPERDVALAPTFWRLQRRTQAETARVAKTLTDTPFYARSLLATRLLGEDAHAMHESVSLDRFRAAWVQAMLPFRVPRSVW